MSEHKIELNISKNKYDEFTELFPANTDNEIKMNISNSLDHLIKRIKEKRENDKILSDASFLKQTNDILLKRMISIIEQNLKLFKNGIQKIDETIPDDDPRAPINYCNSNFIACQSLFDTFLIYSNYFCELNSIDTRSTSKLLDNPFIVWNFEFVLKRHASPNIKIDYEIHKARLEEWNLLKNNEQYCLHRHKFSDFFKKDMSEEEWQKLDSIIFDAQNKFMPNFSMITDEDLQAQYKLLNWIKDILSSFLNDQSKIIQFKHK